MDPNAAPAGFTLVNEPRLATRIVTKCFIIVCAVVEYDVPETERACATSGASISEISWKIAYLSMN
jgi:hypothetical protein